MDSRSLRRARSVLHLSQGDLGKEIGRVMKTQAVEQGTIALWESGKKAMDFAYTQAVGTLLANWYSRVTQRDNIGLSVAVNSLWTITVWAKCTKHQKPKWYHLRRSNQYDCGKHK